MCHLCSATYIQLGFVYRQTVLWCHRTKNQLYDEERVVFFPLGLIFRAIGGIPVDRSRNTSLVDQMANKFAGSKLFHLAITPKVRANPTQTGKRFLLHCVESTSSYHAYRYRLSYQDYNFHQGNNANRRL